MEAFDLTMDGGLLSTAHHVRRSLGIHARADTECSRRSTSIFHLDSTALKRRSWLTPMTLPAAAVRAEVALGADAYISQADPLAGAHCSRR